VSLHAGFAAGRESGEETPFGFVLSESLVSPEVPNSDEPRLLPWWLGLHDRRLRIVDLRDSQPYEYVEFELPAIFSAQLASEFSLLWRVAHATRWTRSDSAKTWMEQWVEKFKANRARRVVQLTAIARDSFSDLAGPLTRELNALVNAGQDAAHSTRLHEWTVLLKQAFHRWMVDRSSASTASETPNPEESKTSPMLGASRDDSCTSPRTYSTSGSMHLDESIRDDKSLNDQIRSLMITACERRADSIPWELVDSRQMGEVHERLINLILEWDDRSQCIKVAHARSNDASASRKQSGSFYTSDRLVHALLDKTLEPMLHELEQDCRSATELEEALLGLRVCDPTVGTARFLLPAAHRIARRLALVRWERFSRRATWPEVYQGTLTEVLSQCVMGVDIDPLAIELARLTLGREVDFESSTMHALTRHMRCGNALLSQPLSRPSVESASRSGNALSDSPTTRTHVECAIASRDKLGTDSLVATAPPQRVTRAFDWCLEFPKIFTDAVPSEVMTIDTTAPKTSRWGFDVVLGNPPWVSYLGRQQVVIDEESLEFLRWRFPALARWPAAHSAILCLALELVAGRGLVGLVLPRQVAELDSYQSVRRLVNSTASLRGPVCDVGEAAFPGVVQPAGLFCFGPREKPPITSRQESWPVENAVHAARETSEHLDGGRGQVTDGFTASGSVKPHARDVTTWLRSPELNRTLEATGTFPARSFFDLGVHSGNVARKIIRPIRGDRRGDGWWPVREGRDITAFACRDPEKEIWLCPELHAGEYCTIRSLDRYVDTPILLRQTANRPIATRHLAPTYFRNSVLGCAGVSGVSPRVVVAILNSGLLALLHQRQFLDARQRAFPQVKIRHLHALPFPNRERLDQPFQSITLAETIEQRTRNAEDAAAREGFVETEVLVELESLVLTAFDLETRWAEALVVATSEKKSTTR
ncbi:MAG: hypothetical protein KDA83_09920, partial [Planctomycetales bacterium]|nr:hypothetical protein [Planctomycetales bacterium]